MTEKAHIFEMAARDGLQNEPAFIATSDKISLIDLLSAAGVGKIEAASFVSPRWVPQMADAADVLAGITREAGVSYTALTPNLAGYQRAVAAGVDEVAIFAAASEGFSQKNINCSIAESLARFAPILRQARAEGMPVRGYISCITDCPYDGPTPPGQVAQLAGRLLEMGCYEISLGDTIGAATPDTTARLLEIVLQDLPASALAGHFHDTRNQALANIDVALDHGLRLFDASAGGLGGCPFAPGAKGNVDSTAVATLLAERGFETGLDPDKLANAGRFARTLSSRQGT